MGIEEFIPHGYLPVCEVHKPSLGPFAAGNFGTIYDDYVAALASKIASEDGCFFTRKRHRKRATEVISNLLTKHELRVIYGDELGEHDVLVTHERNREKRAALHAGFQEDLVWILRKYGSHARFVSTYIEMPEELKMAGELKRGNV